MLCQEIPDLKLPRRQQYLRKPGSHTPGLTKISNVPATQGWHAAGPAVHQNGVLTGDVAVGSSCDCSGHEAADSGS